MALPNDFTIFDLILFTFGTFEDFVFVDLDLDDLLALLLPDFRLFKYRAVTSPEAENALTLPLTADLEDFKDLILGTLDDFPLILLAFLILIDLLEAFKLFDDLMLAEE